MQKVFGVGLSRTGTTSLTAALRILGYNAVHYPLVIAKRRPQGGLGLDPEAVRRFDALTDIPAARFYVELDHAFPGSKFILTIRDPDHWIHSMRKLRPVYGLIRHFPKVEELFYEVYGTRSLKDEAVLRSAYERHNREVKEYFEGREGDLLVYATEAGDGWEKLCNFLGRPVPTRIPFPWHNRQHSTIADNIIDFFDLRS